MVSVHFVVLFTFSRVVCHIIMKACLLRNEMLCKFQFYGKKVRTPVVRVKCDTFGKIVWQAMSICNIKPSEPLKYNCVRLNDVYYPCFILLNKPMLCHACEKTKPKTTFIYYVFLWKLQCMRIAKRTKKPILKHAECSWVCVMDVALFSI